MAKRTLAITERRVRAAVGWEMAFEGELLFEIYMIYQCVWLAIPIMVGAGLGMAYSLKWGGRWAE